MHHQFDPHSARQSENAPLVQCVEESAPVARSRDALHDQKIQMLEWEDECVFLARQVLRLQEEIVRHRHRQREPDGKSIAIGNGVDGHEMSKVMQEFEPEKLTRLSECEIVGMCGGDEEQIVLIFRLVELNAKIMDIKALMAVMHREMLEIRQAERQQQKRRQQPPAATNSCDGEEEGLFLVIPN